MGILPALQDEDCCQGFLHENCIESTKVIAYFARASKVVVGPHPIPGSRRLPNFQDTLMLAQRSGFQAEIRLFGPWIKGQHFEPSVALCGIDNALGRRASDQPVLTWFWKLDWDRGTGI